MVKSYLSDDDHRPVADRLTVQGAEIINYQVKGTLYMLSNGPENELALGTAQASLQVFVNQRRRMGLKVSESVVHARLRVEGLRKVVLQDWTDIVATSYQAPFCTAINLALGVE